jgi:hypothetical protein
MMPKQKHKETQAEQSARFEAEAQRLIDAGELNPTEADKAMDRLVTGGAHKKA